jgi:stage II sporulation protein D
MCRSSAVALVVVLLASGSGSAAAAPGGSRSAASTATFVVTGHGWGHGVGMSQYGAYGYAQHGYAYPKILAHYFPGTQLGTAPVARVRVLLASGAKKLKIASADDFTVRDGNGDDHDVLAGTYTLTPALKLKVDGAQKAQALPGPLLFQPGASPLDLRRRYRGTIQVDVDSGRLRAINLVGLEQYLYGVVPSEMPFGWAPEALKAQAVVARSYALAVRKAGPFNLYPDTRSQVYLGLDHEKPSTNAAVDATSGKVLLYQGAIAKTYFFSTSGGRTASSEDVWGTPIPYLVSVPDPFDSISPYHDWGPFAFSAARFGRVLHAGGAVLDVETALNSSGRVSRLTVETARGEEAFDPSPLRQRLGLRSTWFSVGVLSLTPPDATVVYGSSVRLTGLARGLSPVTLQNRFAGGWQDVGQVSAGKDGALGIAVKPTVTTDYRLTTGKVSSGSARVPVAPLVRLYSPRTQTELRGYVRPVSAGATALVQRDQGSAWATVARAQVDAAGVFTAALQLTSGTYRARVAPGHGLVPGLSPVLQVTTP